MTTPNTVGKAVRYMASLMCDECDDDGDEPCEGCLLDTAIGLQGFLSKLPDGELFSPMGLGVMIEAEVPLPDPDELMPKKEGFDA